MNEEIPPEPGLPRWRRLEWQETLRRELRSNREQARNDGWLAWALAALDELDTLAERLDCLAHDLDPASVGQCHRLAREVSRCRDALLGLDSVTRPAEEDG